MPQKLVTVDLSAQVTFRVPNGWTASQIDEAVDAIDLKPFFNDYSAVSLLQRFNGD